jgi:hypothetical protein
MVSMGGLLEPLPPPWAGSLAGKDMGPSYPPPINTNQPASGKPKFTYLNLATLNCVLTVLSTLSHLKVGPIPFFCLGYNLAHFY